MLATINMEDHEDNPRNTQARNTNSPRIQEEYITRVSEKLEGRVTKKLSQESIETKNRILDALSRVDQFLLNPQPGLTPARSGDISEFE